MNPRSAFIPVAVAVFLGLARGAAPAPRAMEQPAQARRHAPENPPKKTQETEAARVVPGGVYLLREYLPLPRTTTSKPTGKSGLPASIPATGVVIATLPDPTDSHLDWAFDSDFEAILRAYERSGYVIDRFWLPWSEKFDTLVAGDSVLAARRLREVYPGVVLFRREALGPGSNADGQAALPPIQILYLVGETPTAGVHKGALRRALEERDTIMAHAATTGEPVRIVGPSFSGSARSILTVLQERSPRGPPPDSTAIITGASTGIENLVVLDSMRRTSYEATVHSEGVLTRALIRHVICPLGLHEDEVAILRESGTVYGATATREPGTVECPDTRPVDPSRFVTIPFPMNIGGLRTEFEENASSTQADGAQPTRGRARLTLRDPERPMDRPAAASSLTTPTLEVLLDEIENVITEHRIRAVGILASDVRDKIFLARELRRRQRDVQLFTFEGNALYLVPENNASLRGMLVISSYPLPMQAQWWMRGRLDGLRLSFPNEGAIGIHNAVLRQLGTERRVVAYGLPMEADSLAPKSPPVWISAVGRRAMMPVLVDTVAEPGFLRAVRTGAPRDRERLSMPFFTGCALLLLSLILVYSVLRKVPRPERLDAIVQPEPRPARRSLGDVLDRQGSLPAGGPPARRRRAGRAAAVPAAGTASREVRLDEIQWGSLRLHQALYAMLRCLALLSVFLPVAVLTALAQFSRDVDPGRNDFGRWVVLGGLALAGTFGVAATLWFLWRVLGWLWFVGRPGLHYMWSGWQSSEKAEKWLWRGESVARGLVVAWGIFYFALALRFTAQIAALRHDATALELFVSRAATLDSGVSPVLPLILAGVGYALWCTWHLQRIDLLCRTTPFEAAWRGRWTKQPEQSVEEMARSTALPWSAASPVHHVRSRLFMVVPDLPSFMAILCVLALGTVIVFQIRPTIEAMTGLDAFDWLLGASIGGSIVATCWGVYRLLAVWRELDRVLEGMGQTPLLPAFGRLPDRVAHLTRLTLWRPPSREVVDTAAAVQWRVLKHLHQPAVPGLEALDPTIPSSAGEPAFSVQVASFLNHGPLPSRFERRLARFDGPGHFAQLNDILSELWKREPDEAVLKDITGDDLKKAPEKSLATLFRGSFPNGLRVWLRAAEEFAAIQVVDYIEWVLQQMRSLALFLFVSMLLTIALISSYPFQGQSVIKLLFLFVLLASVGSLLYVMSALNREPLLSAIAKTDAGRLTFDRTFVVNAVAVAVVPLLTLISSSLPDWHVFGFLNSIVHAITGGG